MDQLAKSVYIPMDQSNPLSFFLDLGPLCNNANYAECHQLAQDNFKRCDAADHLCSCYYINVVHQECRQLCPTFHHETYYRLKSLCSQVSYQSIIESLPVEHIDRINSPDTSDKALNGSISITTSTNILSETSSISVRTNENKTTKKWKFPKKLYDYDEFAKNYNSKSSPVHSKVTIGVICILILQYILFT